MGTQQNLVLPKLVIKIVNFVVFNQGIGFASRHRGARPVHTNRPGVNKLFDLSVEVL